MKCRICNEKDIILYPYKHRICYDCYKHLPDCESCKKQIFRQKKDNITSTIMFAILQIFFYVLFS